MSALVTVATLTARHWVTHTVAGRQHAACGQTYGTAAYPSVLMPGACIDCTRCAAQLEAFELAELASDVAAATEVTR